jgi:hypothetical protein
MKYAFYLLFLITIIFSCKSAKSIIDLNPPQLDKAIELVYKAVLDSEFKKEINTYMVTIVDRSMGKTIANTNEYKYITNDSINELFWNKQIYPRANYIDGRLVSEYKDNNSEQYYALIKQNSGYGYYELWIPEFSEDRIHAVINVKFFFAERDAITFQTFVKWEKHIYRVIKTEKKKFF